MLRLSVHFCRVFSLCGDHGRNDQNRHMQNKKHLTVSDRARKLKADIDQASSRCGKVLKV